MEELVVGEQGKDLLGIAEDETVGQDLLVLELGRRSDIDRNVANAIEEDFFEVEEKLVSDKVCHPPWAQLTVKHRDQLLTVRFGQFQEGNDDIADHL
jgi:hypothetical protein